MKSKKWVKCTAQKNPFEKCENKCVGPDRLTLKSIVYRQQSSSSSSWWTQPTEKMGKNETEARTWIHKFGAMVKEKKRWIRSSCGCGTQLIQFSDNMFSLLANDYSIGVWGKLEHNFFGIYKNDVHFNFCIAQSVTMAVAHSQEQLNRVMKMKFEMNNIRAVLHHVDKLQKCFSNDNCSLYAENWRKKKKSQWTSPRHLEEKKKPFHDMHTFTFDIWLRRRHVS